MKMIYRVILLGAILLSTCVTAFANESVLTVVATVAPDKSEEELKAELVFAIKQIPGLKEDAQFEVSANSLSNREYAALLLLFEDIATGGIKQEFQGFGLTLSTNQQWIIEDDSPDAPSWDGIEVKYKSLDGKEKTELFPLGGSADENVRFRAKSLSEYGFAPSDEWDLISFRLKLRKKDEFTESHDFPEPDQHYVVRIKGDVGVGFDKVYETLLNTEKVGQAIMDIRRPKAATLVLANFKYRIPDAAGSWDGNQFTATVNPLVGAGRCKKVWMLFPLSRKQKDDAIKDLEERGLLSNVFAFGNALQNGSYKSGNDDKSYDTFGRVTFDEPSILLPTMEPAWYELNPHDGAGQPTTEDDVAKYQRRFEVKSIDEWKKQYRGEDSETWRIIAFQFEGADGTPRIIRVKSKQTDTAGKAANDSPVPAWPIGLGLK